jgi:hypothetical protein
MRAILIPADDTRRPIQEIQHSDSLEEMQEIVGGNIEYVPFMGRPDVFPIINDEGKFLDLPVNYAATAFLAESLQPGDYIAGDCLVMGANPETGETTDLPTDIHIF